jgi:hypothetical protein
MSPSFNRALASPRRHDLACRWLSRSGASQSRAIWLVNSLLNVLLDDQVSRKSFEDLN